MSVSVISLTFSAMSATSLGTPGKVLPSPASWSDLDCSFSISFIASTTPSMSKVSKYHTSKRRSSHTSDHSFREGDGGPLRLLVALFTLLRIVVVVEFEEHTPHNGPSYPLAQ